LIWKNVTALRHHLFRLMSLWPPYLGAGIYVQSIDPHCRRIEVRMRMLPWTRNYVGTHFGGSLYAMTDPFFMLMLIQNLGKDYIIWDKAASIRFKKPGTGLVRAVFELPESRLAEIREQLKTAAKIEPVFHVNVLNAAGEVVAEVEKLLYIRHKKSLRQPL